MFFHPSLSPNELSLKYLDKNQYFNKGKLIIPNSSLAEIITLNKPLLAVSHSSCRRWTLYTGQPGGGYVRCLSVCVCSPWSIWGAKCVWMTLTQVCLNYGFLQGTLGCQHWHVHVPWLHLIHKIVDHQWTPDLTIWFMWPKCSCIVIVSVLCTNNLLAQKMHL